MVKDAVPPLDLVRLVLVGCVAVGLEVAVHRNRKCGGGGRFKDLSAIV